MMVLLSQTRRNNYGGVGGDRGFGEDLKGSGRRLIDM